MSSGLNNVQRLIIITRGYRNYWRNTPHTELELIAQVNIFSEPELRTPELFHLLKPKANNASTTLFVKLEETKLMSITPLYKLELKMLTLLKCQNSSIDASSIGVVKLKLMMLALFLLYNKSIRCKHYCCCKTRGNEASTNAVVKQEHKFLASMLL